MNLIIDTHVFLWLMQSPEKLSQKALDACEDLNNSLCFSVVSAWEIEIKQNIGKLQMDLSLEQMLESNEDLQILPVELSHVFNLRKLPLHHNDPFDRLLIAQAQYEKTAIVSADKKFKQYDIDLIW